MALTSGIDVDGLLKNALARGGDFAELFIERTRSTAITSEARRIESFLSHDEFGVGLRVVLGDMSAYAYTNDPDALGDLPQSVAAAMREGQGTAVRALEARPARSFACCLREGSAADKIALMRRAEEVAWGHDPAVRQVKVIYGESLRQVSVANSLGFQAGDARRSLIFAVRCVAARDDHVETGYEPVGGSRGLELLEETPPEEVARRAVKRALRCLSAPQAPAGRMPVVLSSEAGGTMVHEAIGHGLEADLAGAGLSVYSGRIGEQVASKAVTVIDDATLPGRRGSLGCDDEGTPAGRTVLVERGILRAYLTDLITSRTYGLPLTGNGRRASFRHRPLPRMTNTLIQPGELSPSEIIARVERGLLVKRMGGGQVNTVNGDFVFEISEGYLIEKGAVAHPIRGATLVGNGPKVLTSIEHIANDLGFGLGTCGKDGQGVAVSDAQPTLLIPEITIGGRIK